MHTIFFYYQWIDVPGGLVVGDSVVGGVEGDSDVVGCSVVGGGQVGGLVGGLQLLTPKIVFLFSFTVSKNKYSKSIL